MTKSITSMSNVAGFGPEVAVLAVGAACMVALVGMVLGYDIEFDFQEKSIRLTKSVDAIPQLCER